MDKLEILSVDLLDRHRQSVGELRKLARTMRLDFGWHYLLDLVWMIDQIDLTTDKTVMDAGAGVGIMQWYLACKGVDVYSVDRGSRADLAIPFRARFPVSGLRSYDLDTPMTVVKNQLAQSNSLVKKIKVQTKNLLFAGRGLLPKMGPGKVIIYNQDLKDLKDIDDNSMNTVVAVSALEHNTPDGLREVVKELLRVLKPGGKLLATLGAATKKDWFHDASHGWNYTADTLREIFSISSSAPDNYDQHDELFEKLKNNAELRDNLAGFYSKSGDNGMPWGKWDPQYIPVGVRKVKRA